MQHLIRHFTVSWTFKLLSSVIEPAGMIRNPKSCAAMRVHKYGCITAVFLATVFWRRDSSVAVATRYGLDGPGSNPGGVEIFRTCPDRLRPTQSPIKWVPGLTGDRATEAWH